METIQHIIIDNTLSRIGEEQFTDYLCHAYCYGGYCTFDRNFTFFGCKILYSDYFLSE